MRLSAHPIVLGATLIFGLLTGVALAQEQPAAGSPPPPPAAASQYPQTPAPPPNIRPNRPPYPVWQVREMTRRLGLTPQQESQVEGILADRQRKIQSVRADPTLAPMQRRARVGQIARNSIRRINGVLSYPQRRQYRQLRQEWRARRMQRQQQRQSQAPPPPNYQ